jgi:hypothetical protein
MTQTAVIPRRLRRGVLILVAGVVCAMAGAFLWRTIPPAHAETKPSSFGLFSGARGWRFFDEDSTNGNQEAEVPESSANLSNGPVGYGLSSVLWPGPMASNAGTLVLVLRPDAPRQVTLLNDPLRAEARTGQKPPTTTNNSIPGTLMTATANADLVEAQATVNNSAGPGTFGPTQTHALATLVGATGRAASSSLVQNINVAAGAVKIDSVSSVANATTDGVNTGGEAHTTVNGLKIAGQPATIDDTGLHIGALNQPANAVANQIAQQALSKSGATLTLSKPTKETTGATTTVTAGSLVVSWNAGSGSVFTVTIGGATATVTAVPGGGSVAIPEVVIPPTGRGSVLLPTVNTGGSASPLSGAAAHGPATPLGTPTPTSTNGMGTVVAPPTVALAKNPRILEAGSVVLVAFAAGLIAVGMRKLSDVILVEPTAAVCPLAEDDG